ncbi:unnamed protein product [Ranitomeya imitator]|uniref:2Fe-2S ferredoxin-type domain-containing protein n=1 Tax=Ranitomeya imitator TaxID=111125 RepID=A0ABN9L497_9NEOB|nr:unnamed protein product [Ranitomeya imitator]
MSPLCSALRPAGADSAEKQNAEGRDRHRNITDRFFLANGTSEENLKVNFINRDGETLTATAKEGESLLELVIRHHLSIDGFGACEGTLACSTCHLIFDQKTFDQLSPITDEEMDMLDLAFGLTKTSRLGCQICMTKALDGITVRVPKDLSDARRDQVEQQSKQ